MPFVQIQPKATTRTSSFTGNKITMGAYLGEGPSRPRQISVRIPKLVMDATSFLVVNRRVLLDMHEGVGEDTGFIQLFCTEDKRVGTVGTQGINQGETTSNHGFSVSFRFERFQYYVPNEWPIPATEVNHIIEDGNIIIECPDWLRPNIEKMKADGLYKDKFEAAPRPLPRQSNSKDEDVDIGDLHLHLNRKERRAVAAKIVSKLR